MVSDDDASCVYCEATKPMAQFNREHVMPEAFGKFEENLVLHADVCRDCNDFFGRTLDLALARDSKEGLDRFEHGVVEPKRGRRLGRRITVKQRGGRFDGAFLEWDLDASGTELKAKPSAQVGFAVDQRGPFTWYRVEDLPDAEHVRSVGYAYFVTGGLPVDEAQAVLANMGLQFGEVVEEVDPPDPSGMLDTTTEGRIDQTIRRAVSKIAFNYLTHRFPAIASMEQFREVRRYIRYGEAPTFDPVSISTRPILGGLPETQQVIGHVVTVRWDAARHQVIAQVSLFGWVQYVIVLSTASFLIPPLCVESGHAFNPFFGQVAQLTRNRSIARPFPLLSKEELLARRAADKNMRGTEDQGDGA